MFFKDNFSMYDDMCVCVTQQMMDAEGGGIDAAVIA
jgi:hypothetical protein